MSRTVPMCDDCGDVDFPYHDCEPSVEKKAMFKACSEWVDKEGLSGDVSMQAVAAFFAGWAAYKTRAQMTGVRDE